MECEEVLESITALKQLLSEYLSSATPTELVNSLYISLIALRKTQRNLQLSIEEDKQTVRNERNNAETAFEELAALKYTAQSYQQEIDRCKDLDINELNILGTDTTENKSVVFEKLNEELATRTSLKTALADKQVQLEALKEDNKLLENKIKRLPRLTKTAERALSELQDTYGFSLTDEYETLQQIQSLPESLYYIYSTLSLLPVTLSIVKLPTQVAHPNKKFKTSYNNAVQLTIDAPSEEHWGLDLTQVYPISLMFSQADNYVKVKGRSREREVEFLHKWVSPGEEQPYAWVQYFSAKYLEKPLYKTVSPEYIIEKLREAAVIECAKNYIINTLFIKGTIPDSGIKVKETTFNSMVILINDGELKLDITIPQMYPLELPVISALYRDSTVETQQIVKSAYNSIEDPVGRAKDLLPLIITEIVKSL